MRRRVFQKFWGSFVSLEPTEMFCMDFNSICSEVFLCPRNCVPSFPLLAYLQTLSCTTFKVNLTLTLQILSNHLKTSPHFISCLWKSLREQMGLVACLRNQQDSGSNEPRQGANSAVKDPSLIMPWLQPLVIKPGACYLEHVRWSRLSWCHFYAPQCTLSQRSLTGTGVIAETICMQKTLHQHWGICSLILQ